ncbi:hypothetical protein L1987_83598 [Smallanthus sonchifolius]|uniref:Uncharacterized protein n=1 Tax=Smallanthus sonchifolius TaxID=185202 RepID=A0ACB8YD99_9ASTR|nr:hypothetical protein L1987_83598 [Smallanthus sonchifolius]
MLAMPNLSQVEALIQAYSPVIYFHPDEEYFPSSVNWFFQNGALLYEKGKETEPSPIQPDGSNLPQGGSNDESYWLDLPTDDSAKERIKKEHSGGQLIDALDIEFENGNKPVAYASLHGHAFYSKPGLVLQGSGGIGIRNDASKGQRMMDTGDTPMVVAAEYLGRAVVEPPWLNYSRKWGPKISYDIRNEINKVRKVLPNVLRGAFDKFVGRLPNELLGEEGPTGPKMKNNWSGDEKY